MERIKNFSKKNYWMLFPVVHIISSFFYEQFFFNWDKEMGTLFSVPINESVSNSFEFVITYIISKLIASVFIWLIWKLIFGIIKGDIPKKIVFIFGGLFFIFCAICLVKWPQSLIGDGTSDHLVTYLYAKSFIPYYWHSIVTGCLYSACFMVAPTAFSLPVMQCLMVFSVLGYVFSIIDRYTQKIGKLKWAKYLTLAAVISPQFIDLLTNSWRCCYYAVLVMVFFAMIIETILFDEKVKTKRLVILMIIASILSVWRSEGILYGAFGFLALLLWGYRYKWKKVILWMFLFCVTFFLMGRPTAIGQEKYYGKDYLMVCFVTPLTNIFNDSQKNLCYEGADADVAAIEAVVPISVLRQYAYQGYLSNNYSKGFIDIDQSGASQAEGKAFVKASIRIILHNFKTYIKTQINMCFNSFDYSNYCYIEGYSGEKDEYKGFSLAMWENGKAELINSPGVERWMNYSTKNRAMNFVEICRYEYTMLWNGNGKMNCKFFGLLILVLANCIIVLREIIGLFMKKSNNIIFGCISLLLLAVLAVTILMMPTPMIAYFYTFIYCSFMVIVFYGIRKFEDKKTSKQ